MKYLLLFYMFHIGHATEVYKYEAVSESHCQIDGAKLAKRFLTVLPNVDSVRYECVERGY